MYDHVQVKKVLLNSVNLLILMTPGLTMRPTRCNTPRDCIPRQDFSGDKGEIKTIGKNKKGDRRDHQRHSIHPGTGLANQIYLILVYECFMVSIK